MRDEWGRVNKEYRFDSLSITSPNQSIRASNIALVCKTNLVEVHLANGIYWDTKGKNMTGEIILKSK